MHEKAAKIKDAFKELFLLTISDAEAQALYDEMIPHAREMLASMPGSEAAKERYMQGNELMFTPRFINAQILRIAEEIGADVLNDSRKHKRLYEMASVMGLVLSLKKTTGREWMILSQDNPDILLISPNMNPIGKKAFDAVPVEIMQIPEEAKVGFEGELETAIAEFIRLKKFNKRYNPLGHLLVHLDFNQENVSTRRISDVLRSFPGNPYLRIWARVNPVADSYVASIISLTPDFSIVDIDLQTEQDLLF